MTKHKKKNQIVNCVGMLIYLHLLRMCILIVARENQIKTLFISGLRYLLGAGC